MLRKWIPIEIKSGQEGPDGGTIIEADEYPKTARISIERKVKVADGNEYYAVTMGVYGLLVHTAYFGSFEDAKECAFAVKLVIQQMATDGQLSDDDLLEYLLRTCTASMPSRREIKLAMEDILAWLVAHNTDANCRKVDTFLSTRISQDDRNKLPGDIQEILFDMGGALHDTHTSPTVARNFESTPAQLLERVRKLPS